MKGSYALLIYLNNNENIRVGALGRMDFPKGYYVYIGSAMNGIAGRVRRHQRNRKEIHWHVDYLLNTSEIKSIYFQENKKKLECSFANKFSKEFQVVPGFGSSDCKCKGHLFYGGFEDLVQFTLENGMKEFIAI